MSKTSWVEICVSNFEQSIHWFENVLGFRVVARDEDEYAEEGDVNTVQGKYEEVKANMRKKKRAE